MFNRDHINQEGIVFGPASDPAVAEHAEKWAGEPVETGSQALAFAEVMRVLTGIGLVILAFAVFGRGRTATEAAPAPAT